MRFWGLPKPLSVKISVPVRGPSCVGVKLTVTLHFLPPGSPPSHLFVRIAKSPVVTMLLMYSMAVPMLLSHTGWAGLVLPTATLPKLNEAGETVTAGVSVNVSVVVCAKLPEVPVTSSVTVPVTAVASAVSVKVLVLVSGFGVNCAVTPFGKLGTESDTLPLNPFHGVIVIVLVPWLP